jgi:hypothetical protein|tara:strand:+ start:9290 stop:9592 length:303 start_codon:yes stop_codon:yes gene_type:complete
METFDKIKIVKKAVQKFFDDSAEQFIHDNDIISWEENHIITTGTQIMAKKWKVSENCGGFVDSVVANDLSKTMASADNINMHAVRFYCAMIYNVSKPKRI